MKIITDRKEINDLLQFYAGAKVQIAFYSESLKRIAIRVMLSHMDEDEEIYLIGIGCESITGQFGFSDANLFISFKINKEKDEEWTILSDRNSGFELATSSGFSLAKGKESEFGTSFDQFFIKR